METPLRFFGQQFRAINLRADLFYFYFATKISRATHTNGLPTLKIMSVVRRLQLLVD